MGIKERMRRALGLDHKELMTPKGMGVVATTAEPEAMPESTDRIAVEKEEGEPVLHKCGHTAPMAVEIHCYGLQVTLTEEAAKAREKCGTCCVKDMKKYVIRCGLCGLPIMPGDGVALYSDNRKTFKDRTRVTLSGGSVVGCLAMNCCPSGGFYAGHWTGTKVKSAFEGGLSAAELAMKTGKTVIVDDIGGPPKK